MNHDRAREIFDEAASLPAKARDAFLDEACGDDTSLRNEVKSLMGHYESHPTVEEAEISGTTWNELLIGTRIGNYKLISKLGEGGMGVVYLAQQTEPLKRRVAIKVVKAGVDSKIIIARFEAERQALALMNHPGIASVYETGVTDDGRPYFVMEYIEGQSITTACDTERLKTLQRLQLLVKVCDAVQHAHERGIIHRDLKPSNIMVVRGDDDQFHPKIIDFGVAKATSLDLSEMTDMTQPGQLIGTPAYMSPEQIDHNQVAINSRSDVYALGVVMYELISGLLPFDPKSLAQNGLREMRRVICEQEPPRPSEQLQFSHVGYEDSQRIATARRTRMSLLIRKLSRELEWIPLKALRKSSYERYQSARAMGEDIRRYLAFKPLEAGAESALYRFRKTVSRNKGVLSAYGAVLIALFAGIITTSIFAVQSRQQAAVAEQQKNEAIVARDNAEHERVRTEAVKNFMTNILTSVDPQIAGGKDKELLKMVLANAANEVGEKFESLPLIEAELRSAIAKTYSAFELYEEAESHIFAAFSIGRRVLGDDHPQTIRSMIEMGDLFVIQGKYDRALPYYTQANATASRILGEDHPDTLNLISGLGNLFFKQGNYEKAWSYHTEALERRRHVLGDDHLDTLNSGSNVGDLLAINGRYDEAMIYYTVVLETARRTLGSDHPTVCQSLGNIGDMLLKQGKYDEVMPYYTEASEIARDVFGDDHPKTLRLVTNIADLLLKQGDYSKALLHCIEALENAQRYFGQGHAYTLQSFRNIISIYEAWEDAEPGQGHQAKADEYQRNYHEVLATEHPRWIVEASSVARLSDAQRCFEQWLHALTKEKITRETAGDMELVVRMLPSRVRRSLYVERTLNRDELELFEKAIPHGLLAPAIFSTELAAAGKNAFVPGSNVARNSLKIERRLSVLEKDLVSKRKKLGDEHIDTLVELFNCGLLYLTINKYQEALVSFEEILKTSRRVFGQDHPYTIASIANVGYVLNAQGQYDQAMPYYVEALKESRRLLGDEHARTAEKMLGVGTLLSAQGKYDQARPYYAKAVETNRRVLGSDHPQTLVAIDLLCCLVAQQGNFDEAVEISRRFLGDDHSQTFDLMSKKIGGLLTYRSNYDQAHGFIEKALELSSGARGEYGQSTISVRSDLVSFYLVWHLAEPGQGYGAKASELIDKNYEMMDKRWEIAESNDRTVETSPDYPTE